MRTVDQTETELDPAVRLVNAAELTIVYWGILTDLKYLSFDYRQKDSSLDTLLVL